MTEISVSVIIVSRDRPEALQRCLTGIEQLDYRNFEVVIVADPAGCAAVRDMGFGDTLRLVEFDEPNISAARNLGLAQASGEIVAFIDDDSVPEPSWLSYLVQPFDDPDVAAAGGFVRGRNGISFQSTAAWVDECGDETPISNVTETTVFSGKLNKGVKTEGTNCAFRRTILKELNGFDPAFRFYLDETDVNLRLGASNLKTAIVPLAQVHHGYFPSAYRAMSRMPKDLFEIGASQTVFLRKHASPVKLKAKLDAFRAEQRARVLRHMIAGTCEPCDIAQILQTLENGIVEGNTRVFGQCVNFDSRTSSFMPFTPRIRFNSSKAMVRLGLKNKKAIAEATLLLKDGVRVTLFQFSLTAFYHKVEFVCGIWIHKGGLFGRSARRGKMFKLWRKKSRFHHEIGEIMPQRLIKKT